MSKTQRIVLLAAAAVVVVVAIVVVGGGGDDKKTETTTTQAAGGAKSQPAVPTIEIKKGAPVGGVKDITLNKGDQIRLVVTSTDTTDEIHMHGYDKKMNLSPGHPARFDVPATIDGVFEVELEDAGKQIAELKVEP
jgi:hypothetical protein